MRTVDFIRDSLDFAHRAFADARNGTDEQLHFIPEGGSHSIAWCLWHAARIEDLIVRSVIRGEPQLWSEEWAQRTGLPADGFGTGQPDDEARTVRIADMSAFAEYVEAVWADTGAYLGGLSDDDLDREVKLGQRTERVGESIGLHLITHFNGHRGEINTLRGMQGMPPVLANARGQAPA